MYLECSVWRVHSECVLVSLYMLYANTISLFNVSGIMIQKFLPLEKDLVKILRKRH